MEAALRVEPFRWTSRHCLCASPPPLAQTPRRLLRVVLLVFYSCSFVWVHVTEGVLAHEDGGGGIGTHVSRLFCAPVCTSTRFAGGREHRTPITCVFTTILLIVHPVFSAHRTPIKSARSRWGWRPRRATASAPLPPTQWALCSTQAVPRGPPHTEARGQRDLRRPCLFPFQSFQYFFLNLECFSFLNYDSPSPVTVWD